MSRVRRRLRARPAGRPSGLPTGPGLRPARRPVRTVAPVPVTPLAPVPVTTVAPVPVTPLAPGTVTRAAALALAVLAAACASGSPRTFDPPPLGLAVDSGPVHIAARIRVIGRVVDQDGGPVRGAEVHVRAHTRRACAGGVGAMGTVRTRPDGWFAKTLYFYSLREVRACVAVVATPAAGSGLAVDSVRDLWTAFLERGAIDTVLTTLTLHPREPGPPPRERVIADSTHEGSDLVSTCRRTL